MTPGQDYQLNASMLAVIEEPTGKKTATTIPAGDKLRVTGSPAADSQHLIVVWQGRLCEVFKVDFEERAEPVKTVREARV
jgi:hypothetical protein